MAVVHNAFPMRKCYHVTFPSVTIPVHYFLITHVQLILVCLSQSSLSLVVLTNLGIRARSLPQPVLIHYTEGWKLQRVCPESEYFKSSVHLKVYLLYVGHYDYNFINYVGWSIIPFIPKSAETAFIILPTLDDQCRMKVNPVQKQQLLILSELSQIYIGKKQKQ